MAPKKKKKSEEDDALPLEEEAMTEWLARGLLIQDFTMEKMMGMYTKL
jgi:hypothetical protein